MRRLASTTLAIGAVGALAGTLLAAGPSTGSAPGGSVAPSSARTVPFALKATGFGTRVTGGDVPVGSGQTAFMALGCSTRVGINKENHEAEVTIPGLGRVSAVRTDLWTREVKGVVSTYSRNTIGNVVIAQSGLGRLQLSAVTAFAHAFHDSKGFHAETKASLGGLQFVPTGGPPQDLPLPAPGAPVEVPGLATIKVGASTKQVNHDGARAQSNALVIDMTATHSRVSVGQAKAQVLNGVENGVFGGFSAGTRARGLDGNVTSGRTPLSLMPCQGTGGKVESKKLASVDLGSNLAVGAVQSQQMARSMRGKSVTWERGSIAGLNLGDGQLVLDGVVGKVTVTREGRKLTKSYRGSTVGTITANGEKQAFPDTGVIEIPGVARIERFVKESVPGGASIVALRVTLLDGTGAVLDLGLAKATIRR
jgi:hypothetical protein